MISDYLIYFLQALYQVFVTYDNKTKAYKNYMEQLFFKIKSKSLTL